MSRVTVHYQAGDKPVAAGQAVVLPRNVPNEVFTVKVDLFDAPGGIPKGPPNITLLLTSDQAAELAEALKNPKP